MLVAINRVGIGSSSCESLVGMGDSIWIRVVVAINIVGSGGPTGKHMRIGGSI